jgi:hypothetical protein
MLADGGDQTGLANRAFPKPIKVVVRDAMMNLVGGAKILVSITGEDGGPGGTLSASEIVTDDDGEATVEVTANGQPGTFGLTFTVVEGASTPATTVLTIETIPTVTTLSVEPVEVGVGEDLTLTATVTSERGTPEGDVELIVDGERVGMATLSDGQASLTVSRDHAGTQQALAHFAAQGPYAESSSEAIEVTVSGGSDAGRGGDVTAGWRLSGGGCSLLVLQPSAAEMPGALLILGGVYLLRRRKRRDR